MAIGIVGVIFTTPLAFWVYKARQGDWSLVLGSLPVGFFCECRNGRLGPLTVAATLTRRLFANRQLLRRANDLVDEPAAPRSERQP